MHLRRIRHQGTIAVGLVEAETIRVLDIGAPNPLSHILHSADPAATVRKAPTRATVSLAGVETLPPIDAQEVWAAGVTYIRSKVAREEESAGSGGARFYDMVYTADRPELFFKAPASRVIADGGTVRIRRDARWSVPEPELALVVSPAGKIVGYTAGNDMSSRDIEGVNPLYLPQAKFYDGACAVGPGVTLAGFLPPLAEVQIRMDIAREGKTVFGGSTTLAAMKRSLEELVSWLYRETSFPDGAVLLTGTGVVPPDDFTLAVGDIVTIDIAGIGRLVNTVG
jgi:2-dehydro-3-deoxy-D-arabinonate dehydratase